MQRGCQRRRGSATGCCQKPNMNMRIEPARPPPSGGAMMATPVAHMPMVSTWMLILRIHRRQGSIVTTDMSSPRLWEVSNPTPLVFSIPPEMCRPGHRIAGMKPILERRKMVQPIPPEIAASGCFEAVPGLAWASGPPSAATIRSATSASAMASVSRGASEMAKLIHKLCAMSSRRPSAVVVANESQHQSLKQEYVK